MPTFPHRSARAGSAVSPTSCSAAGGSSWLGWIVALVAAFAASGSLAGEFSADYATPGSESQRAGDLLSQRFPARSSDTVDVVWQASQGVDSAAVKQRTDALLAAATRLDGIGDAAPAEVSRDGTIAVARLSLTEKPDSVPVTTGESLISLGEAASKDGLRVEMGGQVITAAQESELSSEAVGLAIAALVLVLTFGTLVAAGLPIVDRAVRARHLARRSSGCSPRSWTCPTGRPRSPA